MYQTPHMIVLWDTRQGLRDFHGYAPYGVLGQQVDLDAPSKKGLKRAEMMVHANRLHRLAQASEVALDAQGSHVSKVVDTQRPGEP